MNELKVKNETIEIARIENEIIQLKNDTARNLIKIGEKLIEVKSKLPHGEWGKWLEEKVDFSQRSANQLMKIAKEFGSNSQSISNLEITKVGLLLDVPSEMRENFIDNNDLKSMSTREIKAKIKQMKDNAIDVYIVPEKADFTCRDVKIADLREFPNHLEFYPNMTGKDYINFMQSIDKYGVIESILITDDNMILSGHQRVRACKDLGLETIPAHIFYSENKQGYSKQDLYLDTFFSSNLKFRSDDFYLSLFYIEIYINKNEEKAKYYYNKLMEKWGLLDEFKME